MSWESGAYGKIKHVFTGGAREHRSQWAAICSIAEEVGCSSETLRQWVRQSERDQGLRSGLTTEQVEELHELRRENRELRRANEILRKASAYFPQAECSTANPGDDRFHRRPPTLLWGRADL